MRTVDFRHIIFAFIAVVMMLSSCSDQYNIMGNSSVESYEGSTLYLKVPTQSAELLAYDSTEVVHGRFGFEGVVDTICMAQLFMGESSLMPIVLENGTISISFSDFEHTVEGGTLNDRLYKFLNENARLTNEIQNITRSMARMIMMDIHPKSYAQLEKKAETLQGKLDKLWVSFIVNNSDNVLGPTYFEEYTSQYFYPVITPQIEQIIHHAPRSFLCHPAVRMYIKEAELNMRLMRGNFP